MGGEWAHRANLCHSRGPVGKRISAAAAPPGGCRKRNYPRLNNNRKVIDLTYISHGQAYCVLIRGSDGPAPEKQEGTMRNAVFQIALLIAAVGTSGSFFAATLA